MGNGGKGGSYSYASPRKQWAAFDSLPKSVREQLANGYEDWAPYPIFQQWDKGKWKSADSLIASLKLWDAGAMAQDKQRLLKWLAQQEKISIKRTKERSHLYKQRLIPLAASTEDLLA